VTIVTCL